MLCAWWRLSEAEEPGSSNTILSESKTSDLKCTLFLGRSRSLWSRMAQELSEKELLKMEVEQLKKEVKTPRTLPPVQALFSCTEQIMDAHRQTRAGTTLCFLTDFHDRKGNQGLCGGRSRKRPSPQRERRVAARTWRELSLQ
nr:guanine nucleotide-binding protein G(I)/G(S)/G(O) subunit gamma-T2 isoform X2 [Mirounga angustirostris]